MAAIRKQYSLVCRYQCYNPSQNVSGLKDVLLPICKGFECVAQFVTLFQLSRENIEIGPVESYFCIIDVYKPILWNL